MRSPRKRTLTAVVPAVASAALVLTACGGGSGSATDIAQQPAGALAGTAAGATSSDGQQSTAGVDEAAAAPAGADVQAAPAVTDAVAAGTDAGTAGSTGASSAALSAVDSTAEKKADKAATKAKAAKKETDEKKSASKGTGSVVSGRTGSTAGLTSIDTAAERAENQRIYEQKNGVTDIGVTRTSIKLGTVNMHGLALGNLFVAQLANGIKGSLSAINDRGGILGRRISLVDCDDGTGEVSRTKACIKKMVAQDKIFSLISVTSWGSASIHEDLKQAKLPAFGQWAYSQTEWQDPYMFPTHMSMIHEAMAGANWVRNVIKPKTYGLICLTSPEMQLSCNEVSKVLDASGAKLVKKVDVSISETSMSAQVLAMRAANPDHVIHYVINPATVAKFVVEASQQNYWPAKGLSGNHLAAEVLGSIFGKHPVGRYWTNTTYKMWGPEFTSTMNKYARGNKGANHHIVQASYVGAQIFEKTAKAVGPNLTRERLMAQWGNGDVFAADASLDQKFSYSPSERYGDDWHKEYGQGREFMYKYVSPNTRANPDGSPNGFEPDPDQFVIYTWK